MSPCDLSEQVLGYPQTCPSLTLPVWKCRQGRRSYLHCAGRLHFGQPVETVLPRGWAGWFRALCKKSATVARMLDSGATILVLALLLLLCLWLMGASAASFSTLVVERSLVRSTITGRSRCSCGEQLGIVQLIPVVGWVLQRGIATCCGSRISTAYPILEAISGVVSVFVSAAILWVGVSWPPVCLAGAVGLGQVAVGSGCAICVLRLRRHTGR